MSRRHLALLVPALSLALVAGCSRSEEPSFQPPPAPPPAEPEPEADAPEAAPAATAGAEDAPADGADGDGADADGEAAAADASPALLDPSQATERAPDEFAVELRTGEGPIVLDVHRAWSPKGADRFYNLVKIGFFEDVAFFRVIDGFMAQAGLHGDPAVNRAWRGANIEDDPPAGQSNTRGMVSFAMAGPNTRTTQFFINLVDNARLDAMGFTPFAKVRDMRAVDALYSGYGEGAPRGRGPMQARIQREGNAYLKAEFPNLDTIESARILPTED